MCVVNKIFKYNYTCAVQFEAATYQVNIGTETPFYDTYFPRNQF